MNTNTIIRLLENSGFHKVRVDASLVYMEDPSCVIRSFETFIDYMWVIVTALTGILLFGWALSMIRGAKNDIFSNMKHLVLIFGILSVAKPVMNVMYGGDVFGTWCKTIKVPLEEVNKLLALRKEAMGNLYEYMDIYDSGVDYSDMPAHTVPYSVSPLFGAGEPQNIEGVTSE
jgi:hypothetical protein